MKDKWNHSEPPKERWIIRWDEYKDKPIVVKKSKYDDRWGSTYYFHDEKRFTHNLWMEAPQKPEI